MTTARELIEKVAAGVSAQAVLTEADSVPSWKPGQPVPEGYKVVYGKLKKSSTPGSDRNHHHLATDAWKASATAETHDSTATHAVAKKAHEAAETAAAAIGDHQGRMLHHAAAGHHDSRAYGMLSQLDKRLKQGH